ncbi:MAG: hypothetical protein HQ525_02870 [Anaerolineae bacterium]|nr:hypothetical protein [Anaerolineae bacterium]
MEIKKNLRFVIFTSNLWTRDDIIAAATIAHNVGFKLVGYPDNPEDREKGIYVHSGSPKSLVASAKIERESRKIRQNNSFPIAHQAGPIKAFLTAFFSSQHNAHPGSFIPRMPMPIILRLSLDTFTPKYNTIQGISSDFVNVGDKEIDTMAQDVLELVKKYYVQFQPYYAWVDSSPQFEWVSLEGVLDRKLREIMWGNFFGPAYVDKYGREYLLNSPGWKKEELDDGGVFLQLSKNFSRNEDKYLHNDLKEYFSPLNIEHFPWTD